MGGPILMSLLVLLGSACCFIGGHPKEVREGCRCVPQLCPQPTACLAGLVRDRCHCCLECGNVEGQVCDLEGGQPFHGRCGENLLCQMDLVGLERGEVPQARCVCRNQRAICGSDHKTYANVCAFKKAQAAQAVGGTRNLSMAGSGPCRTAPEIKIPPRDQFNTSGQDAIFLCEVVAYPMAQVEWRKNRHNVSLPGDDPHISVQSRGGPLKYELSSWLQIEGVTLEDAGTYDCIAHNRLGRVTAHAQLRVMATGADRPSTVPSPHVLGDMSSEYEDYY
ncbi:kazal-type serine protease inhibitor domain-containing protein 1-like [Ambystoma mexicanum]|uniref:kazal-type serine protease inhibitor domain-containing protein 1-like n=1 Tax=Ambystoma mexicanum TaxID=8296 RepID=UPI0037E7A681